MAEYNDAIAISSSINLEIKKNEWLKYAVYRQCVCDLLR